MSWPRRLFLLAIAVVVGAGLVYGFMPQPVSVTVAEAKHGPLRVTVDQEARTRVVDRYVVSAPVTGYARRIDLKVGDAVQRGETLAQLAPSPASLLDVRSRAEARARVEAAAARVEAATAQVAAAEATERMTQANAARVRRLRDSGHSSPDALERAEASAREADARLRSARFEVQVARFERDAAQAALRYSPANNASSASSDEPLVIKAPVSGRVLSVMRESEGMVESGQPLLEIGDPAALEVEADVLSRDAVRIKPGMRVLFDRWGGGGTLEGRVRTVEPVAFTKVSALGIEEQRVWVICDITSPPSMWSRLGDKYRLEARFILWDGEHVLQVPESALFRQGVHWAVFVVADRRARLRDVKIGRRGGLRAQVVSGLQAGEEVITHPDDSVRDGVRVRVRKDGM